MELFGAGAGPLLFAHRGARLERPENSLEAFALALALGADALEIDVHMTRDGHPVVAHDASGLRMAGVAAEIRASRLSEVKQWNIAHAFRAQGGGTAEPARMPTLDETLQAFPGVTLNVDVKQAQPDMLGPVLSVIGRHAAEARVLLTSFSSAITRRLRSIGYRGPTGLAQTEAARAVFTPRALLRRWPLSGRRLQIPLRYGPLPLARAALIGKMHALAIAVDYWVVNEPAQAEQLLALGADGVVSDDPRAMAGLFARSPRTEAWRARHAGQAGAAHSHAGGER
jgi:glycerophosphoryl diester phosphodiesterase